MALTGEQKKIAIDAYYRTVSEGKHLDVFAAVEAVLADQGADLNAKYVQGFEDCRAQAMNVVDEHDGFLQRIEFLKPAPIAEQARAAEQPDARAWNIVWELAHRDKVFFAGIDGAMARLIEEAQGLLEQPAQPPAANVVERMCSDYGNLTGTDPDPVAMTAALAVAREGMVLKSDYDECVRMLRIESEAARQSEGYVSLDDVEKAILEYMHDNCGNTISIPEIIARNIVASLAKPAEQTDEQKVEAILRRDWSNNGITYPQLAAEIVAALRDGKEGK